MAGPCAHTETIVFTPTSAAARYDEEMSFNTPVRAAIEALRDPDAIFSMSASESRKILLSESSTDFGDDLDAWEAWARREGRWEVQAARVTHRPDSRTLFDLASKLSRLVAHETITPRNAAHQFMDKLGNDPGQISQAYDQLTANIQAELVTFAEQPEADWLASHFSGVLSDPVPAQPLTEVPATYPARAAFVALREFLKRTP
jgi:hypothetical protein